MSTLTPVDKCYLEKILGMGGGYVLDFTDDSFGGVFRGHGINIHGEKYQQYGTSKARKMRSFWEQEADTIVAKVLSEMLDVYQTKCKLDGQNVDASLLSNSREIVGRLAGKRQKPKPSGDDRSFLAQEFDMPNTESLPIEQAVKPIIKCRLDEVSQCFEAGAYLSVILLCGSILEAILLGADQQNPKQFNSSTASPKKADGAVKHFQDWNLAQFINVASDLGILKPDVKKFSHGLRDFRNYIHPHAQLSSGFSPDQHTARVCFQVLKAALASVAGKRK